MASLIKTTPSGDKHFDVLNSGKAMMSNELRISHSPYLAARRRILHKSDPSLFHPSSTLQSNAIHFEDKLVSNTNENVLILLQMLEFAFLNRLHCLCKKEATNTRMPELTMRSY